jgi:hypothetical protein
MEETGGGAFIALMILVIPIISFFESMNNLIKDIFIPEVRIIEEIKNFNK